MSLSTVTRVATRSFRTTSILAIKAGDRLPSVKLQETPKVDIDIAVKFILFFFLCLLEKD